MRAASVGRENAPPGLPGHLDHSVTTSSTTTTPPGQPTVSGGACAYRLYDVGYSICPIARVTLLRRGARWRIAEAQRANRSGPERSRGLFSRRYSALLGEIQRPYSDSTELIERAENSLKVTDDVYIARVCSAALEIFRGRAWRAGVDRKLSLVRDTYEMLNGMAQARRAEALETAIVVLIVAEIILGVLR